MVRNYILDLLTMKEAAEVAKLRYKDMKYGSFRWYVVTGRVPVAAVKNGNRLFEREDIEKWERVKEKTGRKTNGRTEGDI